MKKSALCAFSVLAILSLVACQDTPPTQRNTPKSAPPPSAGAIPPPVQPGKIPSSGMR